MGNAFKNNKSKSSNSSKTSRITEQDKAILQLKQMRDKLKKYQDKIELQIEKDRELAKELIKQKKIDKAKLLLKKKKYYETNLEKTDVQLDNLDQMVNNIEFIQIEHQVVNGLKVGNDCLKKLNEMMSLDEIEQIMDDTKEGIEYQRKIDELISGQFQDESIDDEINAELEDILADSMPSVPSDKIPIGENAQKNKKEKVHEKNKRVAVEAD